MRTIYIVIIFLVATSFLYSCSTPYKEESILGYWKGNNEYLNFSENNKLKFFIGTGSYISEVIQPKNTSISYEIVKEVTPNQLYLIFTKDGENKRIPFGIYKIENNKLIINKSKEFHRTLGSMDMGVSRYELPADFSGELEIYHRLNQSPEIKGIYYKGVFYKNIQEQEDQEIKRIFSSEDANGNN